MTASTPTILDTIVTELRADLVDRRLRVPLRELWTLCQQLVRPELVEGRNRSFSAALKGDSLSLIAEVKRASPSRGLLRGDLDAAATAQLYRDNGAAAISVLTEQRHFRGSLDDLSQVVAALDAYAAGGATRPPVLRKDFVFDPYQIYEARATGADAVLLIVAILSDGQLHEFLHLAEVLGMEALVEVHDEHEVERALAAGTRLIGINNRDLRTFVTDMRTTQRLRHLIPPDCVVVSESGIASAADAAQVHAWGADAILVGEAIVTALDIAAKVRELAHLASPARRG